MALIKGVFIHPTAEVSPAAAIGSGTKVWRYAHVREAAKIGRDCVVGQNVYIGPRVTVGDRVKIENGVSIYEGVTLEDDAFVGPYATFTNDRYPRAFSKDWKIVPTRVRKGASIGANATVVCGVTLGRYCLVGAGAVVTKDVPAHALVLNVPAKVVGFVCFCGRRLNEGPRNVLLCAKCKNKKWRPPI